MNLLQSTPDISVVMGVRNAADTIKSTIESLRSQQGPSFEIIVVDDGSTDDTAAILKTLAARDPRLNLYHSPPRGLTASLIDACSAARGQFLVRQDAGDWSLPGRFAKQIESLESSPEAVLCSCYVRFTVDDDVMIQIKQIPQELLQDGLIGPSQHGAVMMRRSAYIQAGGYRRMFYYAQDIDLWSRMAELGTHLVVPEVLYRSEASAGSISGSHRAEQARFHRIIVACTKARRSGAPEQPFLRQAEQLSERCRKLRKSRRRMAAGHYFIGSCLANSHPELARRYLSLALHDNPFHIRARLKLLRLR